MALVRWPELGYKLVRPITREGALRRLTQTVLSRQRTDMCDRQWDQIEDNLKVILFLVRESDDVSILEIDFSFRDRRKGFAWVGFHAEMYNLEFTLPSTVSNMMPWAIEDWLGIEHIIGLSPAIWQLPDFGPPIPQRLPKELDLDKENRLFWSPWANPRIPSERKTDIALRIMASRLMEIGARQRWDQKGGFFSEGSHIPLAHGGTDGVMISVDLWRIVLSNGTNLSLSVSDERTAVPGFDGPEGLVFGIHRTLEGENQQKQTRIQKTLGTVKWPNTPWDLLIDTGLVATWDSMVPQERQIPGIPVIDIELYQLIDEDPPPIWPQNEFVEWAKAVSS